MSIALMTEVWKLDLAPSDKMVLLALADAANDDGVTWMAVKSRRADKLDLLKKCSLSERAVQGAIKRLCAGGLLARMERPGKGVIYTVTPAASAPPQHLRPAANDIDPRTSCGETLSNRQSTSEAKASSVARADRKPKPKAQPDLVETIWKLQPITEGKRKATRPDVRAALDGVLGRGAAPADVVAALTAYYALPGCRKESGRFARGAEVMLHADRWMDFLPSAAPERDTGPVDPKVTARRLRHWRDTGSWDTAWGPKPDTLANDVPAPAQRGAAA